MCSDKTIGLGLGLEYGGFIEHMLVVNDGATEIESEKSGISESANKKLVSPGENEKSTKNQNDTNHI